MTKRLRRFMLFYRILWWAALPLALAYLWWRGRRDARYTSNLKERFGKYHPKVTKPVWVHAVSLGELRSAVPLIRALLDRGETVLTTHFTPAGRAEAERLFELEISQGRLQATWIPLEFPFAFKRFFRAFAPKLGLVMEIEVWPQMILCAERAGLPLYLCNAQYPRKSFERDQIKSGWRLDLHRHVAGAFVKSALQKERFTTAGVRDINVTGELRFDQPVPKAQVAAGRSWKAKLDGRRVIALPSVVEGEDETFISAIKSLQGKGAPLFIYIPRAPERFDETAELLHKSNISFLKRSELLDADLSGDAPNEIDVLLGDSMGEMYFYLAAADLAIIGGGFVEKGAHNISEPLMLGLPCVVGPHVWTIEFPVVEAMAAGVVHQVEDAKSLAEYLEAGTFPSSDAAMKFAEDQMGGTARTIEGLVARGLL